MNKLYQYVFVVMIILMIVSCEYKSVTLNKSLEGPMYFINQIEYGNICGLDYYKAQIAVDRWKLAFDGANNAGRPIPILKSIDGPNTAFVVIDMQKVFLDSNAAIEVPEGRKVIANINLIADHIRDEGGLAIWFRYLVNDSVGLLTHFEGKSYLGGDRESPLEAMQPCHPQFELHADLNVAGNDIIMNKTRYSAVLGSHIVDTLKAYNIENVIIAGVTTDVCAGNTAEDLMQMDFHVVMVWDGCAALDRLEHELYLARIFGLYGDVMPTHEVIKRMHNSKVPLKDIKQQGNK